MVRTNKELNKKMLESDRLNAKRNKKEFFLVSGYEEPDIKEYSLYKQNIVGNPFWFSEREFKNDMMRRKK